ncbi:putative acetyltransferase [Streptomyces sp. 3211.6]|uniref:GNAT family N-acetyltransferase n=1 Tax=Streptomyces sp. 3211.6 TaxID=1938845 RepID=UPI000EB29A67|nr:GNAT family N-acetyltransferase [Streptomyces sp. 3211.6]RKT05974.1 putative acetyltransferase [Streptomyces sp. 3211.6]
MSADIRPIAESELPEWMRALNTGFLMPAPVPESDVALRSKHWDLTRTQGAFDTDTGRCVATFRSFAQELTVPGGASVPSSAVTNVSVTATHRRQGLLTRLMAAELTAAKERGDVVSTLIAAEYPIYGRYGYGPATGIVEWEIDVARSGLDPSAAVPGDGGRIDLIDASELRETGPRIHERLRAAGHGTVSRSARWWDIACGIEPAQGRPYKPKFHALYRDPAGEPAGFAVYSADETWTDEKRPLNTLQVKDLIALTPAAERALWRYLCSIDWVLKVRTAYRAPDDLLPLLLPDPRAARPVTSADFVWLRLLDVERALAARTYAVPGVLVLEVADAAGLAEGRYRLDAAAGTCVRTQDPADLALDVSVLGSLYLGDESAARLAALGRVAEERAGAVALADAVFRTARRPWCPDVF